MKFQVSKRILSMLLALVMILGLLPAMAYASNYIKMGEIKAVTAESPDFVMPEVDAAVKSPGFTVKSPTDENVSISPGLIHWQKYNESSETWERYSKPTFVQGTYRLQITVSSVCSYDRRTYYALRSDTSLTVNGTPWTAQWLDDQYEATGYGEMVFVSPEMDAVPVLTVNDNSLRCSVVPVSGALTVLMGDDFSFTIKPADYYELTDPAALNVYVNDKLTAPDKNGVYTVKNVTEDLVIYADGGLTPYVDLVITANGVTVKDKMYAGQSYTLKTVAEYGATVPNNSAFTHWKVSGLGKYQPGESFTVKGGGEIKIDAVFSGLYNITVNNGKAYSDEAHTQPLTIAKDMQKVYIVADEAPEGMVFVGWSWEADPGHYTISWFYDTTSPSTWFTVDSGDIVLTPVYETLVDHITIHGVTKPTIGGVLKETENTWHNWGESVPENAGYSFSYAYWYDITTGESVSMENGDIFQMEHTYRYKASLSIGRDHSLPQNTDDISVTLTGIDPQDYNLTLSASNSSYLNVIVEFSCQREMPDSSYERPVGYGTKSDPFRISTVGELYWFSAFVNERITAPDLTVEPGTACAILMNNITVNPNLLNTDGTLIGAYGFERWIPIGYYSTYSGTFEGQGYTISGLYFDHSIPYTKHRDIGFVANLDNGGCVRYLTVADSWFATPSADADFYMGGIAGYVGDASVIGCSFHGVLKANTNYYWNSIGGIAGVNNGTIDNGWTTGWIKAYSAYGAGGIAGSASGTVKNSLNNAEVINTLPTLNDGGYHSGTGGIVGILREGIVKDCRNNGIVGGNHFTGGIVGQAYGSQDKQALIDRSRNVGDVGGSGIVAWLGDGTSNSATANGYVTVKNCYNKGSVIYSICEYANGSGNSVSYCHNVGISTQQPILGGAAAGSDIVIEHCYYKANSEIDSIGGTAYKTAAEFADGTVLALMDNGNWMQGNGYPILTEIKGVTVSGTVTSFNSDTDDVTIQLFAEGSETANYSTTVKGNSAEYSIGEVAEGTYTMVVSKPNHVSGKYTLTVGTDDITLDVKLHLMGDNTGDGKVNMADVARIFAHVRGKNTLTEETGLDRCDVTGEGKVNMADVAMIFAHVRGKRKLY